MAEGAAASPSAVGSSRGLHSAIIQWLVDNFCICEGCSVPRCLMYEIYMETCGQNTQNQINPATFGKIVRFVFPDLGTRRLGTRGSARYHYDGICIKKTSVFYAQYCYLLGEKRYHNKDVVTFEKSANCNNVIQPEETYETHALKKTDQEESLLPEFRRRQFWEQELAKKHSYKMMVFLADEYCNYCQDILQSVKNQEFDRVQDHLTSFWKSLQQDTVMFMSLPDVCQLFKCYDAQLYKGIEDILLHDFLEDVSIQYLKLVRQFSKRYKLWLLTAVEGFPAPLKISKLKEVTVFVKRIRRKTYLSNMAKTMRLVLKNSGRANSLKSDLHAILSQGALDISAKALTGGLDPAEELESHTEMQCLSSLISLLGTSTDLSVFLNCLSSNLQAFVFQPSRNKEEFMKLAANFQLRWNFLLTAVSKAMTLCHRNSFGSWHLFHLLLLEYVIHILQSCMEEEEEQDLEHLREMLPDSQSLLQPDQALFRPPEPSAPDCANLLAEPPPVTPKHMSQSQGPTGLSNLVLRVLGFLVDTTTGDKLIQVLLEDKATDSAVKLSLPVGQETLVTLRDGQRFVIHISGVPESSEHTYFQESDASVSAGQLEQGMKEGLHLNS
ncbi:DNA-binding protein RFX8 isoform X1 [Ochotona princeps]|uniref:DNA-binding protein RFX8 isoform X1 n=1 Tax=Ochotona princeps TaxID=9978 RepID=UPI002715515E|nr:DNA-binding protein RFX8 isoform X1 [Ochotona princeps]